MLDTAPADLPAQEVRWRCQFAWVLLMLSVLNWRAVGSPFTLSMAQEQAATILVTVAAFVLAVQANPTLQVARAPSLVVAYVLVAASTVPGVLGMAPVNSLLLSLRLALIVLTISLLSPIVWREPMAMVRAHLWVHGVIAACLLAGAVLAPGLAFHPGTRRLTGLVPPLHPSQVGSVASVTAGLAVLAILAGAVGRRRGVLVVALAATVLVASRSRTALLATLLGLLVALGSLALQSSRARRLLGVLVCVAAMTWLLATPAIVGWFARGQTQAQLQSLSGRRATWIAMLDDRPAGVTRWLGIGLGDKRYMGKPIDSGWMAAYWQQGLLGVGLTALLVLVTAWHAVRSRDGLLRAVALFLVVFVTVSANTESGLSDISLYFLSLMLAGVLALARPRPAT